MCSLRVAATYFSKQTQQCRAVQPGLQARGSATGACMLYDPSTNRWILTDSLLTPRSGRTLTRLQNDQVLAVGGRGLSGVLASAEPYTL